MKYPLRMICILFLLMGCKERLDVDYKIFGDYNFNSGDYALYAFGLDGEMIKGKKNFYINSPAVLSELKGRWVFQYKGSIEPCGFGYLFALVHEGKPVEKFNIAMECDYLRNGTKWVYFPASLLLDFQDKFIPLEDDEVEILYAKYIMKKKL